MPTSVKMVILGLLLLVPTGARSQTFSLVVEDLAGSRSRAFDVVIGEQFTVLTVVNTGGNEISAAEWVQTEPGGTLPGLFKLSSWGLCNTCDVFDRVPGEYVESLGTCYPASDALEIWQNTYLPVAEFSATDYVLSVRGFEPGDTRLSTFDGAPGFVDCTDNLVPAEMSGGDAWETGAGVVVPSGAVVLNPTPPLVVGATDHGISHLKARFR